VEAKGQPIGRGRIRYASIKLFTSPLSSCWHDRSCGNRRRRDNVRSWRLRAGTQEPPSAATAPRILRKPPLPELARIAKFYNLDLSRDDLTSFRNLMDDVLASYRRLDQFTEPTLKVKYPRDAGFRPPASDNRLNAWYWRCSLKGAMSGPLAGKKIGIKDNVCVAGIPMMNGSNVLEGCVPTWTRPL
jgi:amidase